MAHKPPHEHVHHHGDTPHGEDDLPERTPLQKALIGLGAFLLILLMVSFVFVNFPVGDILASKSESDLIINQVVLTDSLEIVFSGAAYDELQNHYSANLHQEVSLCLSGERNGSSYDISSLYKPEQQQSFSHVRFEPCSQETLILLHTHPRSRCIASQTDITTLRATQERNPEVIMVVMCEENRVSVYS